MSDNRITGRPLVTQPLTRSTAPTSGPAAAPAVTMAADGLTLSSANAAPSAFDQAKDTLAKAVDLPPMPADHAAKQAWLLDGYARMAKADAAQDVLNRAALAKHSQDPAITDLMFKAMDAKSALRAADTGGVAIKQFYATLAAPAQALVDSLAKVPAPPADRAGKKAWLQKNDLLLSKVRAAQDVMSKGFIQQGVSFDAISKAEDKVFDFQCKLDKVRDELNPPAPYKPGKPGKINPNDPFRPVFGMSEDLSNSMGRHPNNPVVQMGGAIALPIAVMLDTIDLLTRPLQMLDAAQRKH